MMHIELLAIGDEVLYGFTINRNASFIAQKLLDIGLLVTKHTVVADEKKAIQKALDAAFEKNALVIITGGLGPTVDDLTESIVSDWVSGKEKSGLFKNRLGTADGFYYLLDSGCLIALPGVPQEMQLMMEEEVIPFLKIQIPQNKRLFVFPIHTYLQKEVDVDKELRLLQKAYPELLFGIYPRFFQHTVHIKCMAEDFFEAEQKVNAAIDLFKERFKDTLLPVGSLSEAVHRVLIEKGYSVATAESCTGGALCESFVQYPGASGYLEGAIISYSNEVKKNLLSVSEEMLSKCGAVSREVVEQMAEAVQKTCKVDIALAVSGIFGPTGGSDEKPVGLVWMAFITPESGLFSCKKQFFGDRKAISEQVVSYMLALLYDKIK